MKFRHFLAAAVLACAAPLAQANDVGQLLTYAAQAVALYFGGPFGPYIALAIGVASAAIQADDARRRARNTYNDSLRDRTITQRGATEPRRMVLGRQRAGGVLAFIGSTGANKEHMVMIIALAAHECDAIEDIYFNDQKVSFHADGERVTTEPYARTDRYSYDDTVTGDGVSTVFSTSQLPTGVVTAVQVTGSGENFSSQTFPVTMVTGTTVTLGVAPLGEFKLNYQADSTTYYARVRRFLGGPGQTVDAVAQGLFPDAWNSQHPMSGCAGLAVFFDFNEDAFQTTVNVSAIVRGAKVYDPRLDSTAGGSGSHRVNNSTTWQWSENPALLIGYAHMSPLCGRQPASSIRWSEIAAAANVCDQQVDYSTWGLMADEGGTFLTDENDTQLLI